MSLKCPWYVNEVFLACPWPVTEMSLPGVWLSMEDIIKDYRTQRTGNRCRNWYDDAHVITLSIDFLFVILILHHLIILALKAPSRIVIGFTAIYGLPHALILREKK